jgi:mRNA interferase RelE/StbE
MEYRLIYHPNIVSEDLPKISKNIKEIIKRAIEERLLKDPVSFGVPLRKNLKGYRKLRVGDYRVIHKVSGNLIIILKIVHRKEVYGKVFSRLS